MCFSETDKNVHKTVKGDPGHKRPKVSVIIPMYKCADFVDDTLDMVCGQTFRDMEIICVLDGPDAEVRNAIEARQKDDERLILLEQEHVGAGAARNTGLERAKGDYLLFLDADDLFEKKMVERLYEEAIKLDADVVMCSYTETNEWKKLELKGIGFAYSLFPEGCVIDPDKIDPYYESFIAAPWNKLFRRRMIIDNHLRFSETRIMNDEFFVTTAMTCARDLAVVKEDLLTVRRYINEHSISSNRAGYTEDIIEVFESLYHWLRKEGYWKRRREDYYRKFWIALHYNSTYDHNERFVDGIARTISSEPPWKGMCNAEIIQRLELDTGELEEKKKALADEIGVLGDNDPMGRRARLNMMDNEINAIRAIRSTMKNKYGRDLSKEDSPLDLFRWSVRTGGWRETMKKIGKRWRKDVLLKPNGVICAGHLTTGCGFVTFFLPVQAKGERAEIEELSVVIRCNGYYPNAISGEDHDVMTPLGPTRTPLINGGVPTRRGEVSGVRTEVSPGIGIRIQIRFEHPLVKNTDGDKAHNNQPLSVMIYGKIHLK